MISKGLTLLFILSFIMVLSTQKKPDIADANHYFS